MFWIRFNTILSLRRRRSHIKKLTQVTSFYCKKQKKIKINKRLCLNPQEGFQSYYVYILSNKYPSTFYIGVTNNLKLRLQQHKSNLETGNKTFASKYNIEFLVYYEKFVWIQEAITREKELKKWRREKKIELIQSFNPGLEFLDYHFE